MLTRCGVKTLLACSLLAFTACAAEVPDDESVDVIVGDGKADTSSTIHLSSSKTVTVKYTASGDPLDLEVDCGQSADPDTVGMQFTVQGQTVAGYWQWSGAVDAGAQQLKLRGTSGSATCHVKITTATGSCTDSASFHSPQTGHTHIRVGTINPTWGDFPVSGNHWGAWAKWNTVYEQPVETGFLVHNLEHGGLVLSYNCSSPGDSADCAKAAHDLAALKTAFGEERVIVTPAPDQPTRYGVRAWRWGYSSECFDSDRMQQFMADHFRNGREDEDANPPYSYDPTTTDVPCQDLMAAPDSCN